MRLALAAGCAVAVATNCSLAQTTRLTTTGVPLQRIERAELCVTNGTVSVLPDGRLAVDTPSSRAVVRIATTQSAEIRFRYLGPSEGSKPLASGELRRQIGLKLRAQDTCNLLYAMWHIEPDSRIAVSVKRNPGKRTHEECGAHGYVNIKPRTSLAQPKILPGESHTLHADLKGDDLTLVADDRVVWEGTVGDAIAGIEGPVGFRTDNTRFEFEYYAGTDRGTPLSAPGKRITRCVQSAGD